jgi:acetyl-CoA carboxylase carboxyl transferase subunit beta
MNIFNKRKEQLSRFKTYLNKKPRQITEKKTVGDQIEVCPVCHIATTKEELENNFFVCEACEYHFSIGVNQRITQLLDANSFYEFDQEAKSLNPDSFFNYQGKLDQAIEKTGYNEAFVGGVGRINKHKVCFGVLDSHFIMGSMGYVVGDKVTRLIEHATEKGYPLILVSASGGARMQEGILSLMQMAKTSAALAQLDQAKGLYISILTSPTTGGVSASFAMLGDINIGEPKALIGFAGKRVIEKTINETLPPEFQRAEFVLEKGFLDMIVSRKELKSVLGKLLDIHKIRRT